MPSGSGILLLVEDEDAVREVTATILRRRGYTVIEARNGGEAFLACEQCETPIDLLITDLVMPRMSGRELAERLAPMRPAMKVLYISGYSEDSALLAASLKPRFAFLQKPITPDGLLHKVRRVLAGTRATAGLE